MTAWDPLFWTLLSVGAFLAGLGVLTDAVFKVVRGALVLPRRLRRRTHLRQPTR